jgi:hypothetical protein
MSVIYTNDLETGLTHNEPSCDVCKPVQNTFTALTEMFSKSKFLTALFTLIPMVFMFSILLYFEYEVQNFYFQGIMYNFQDFRPVLLNPVILITSLTLISGSLALISIYYGFYIIIGFCSYVYSAIAYWLIINTLIIVFCTWDYLNHSVIGYAFLWSSIASFIWLFSSAVMSSHKRVNGASV